MYRQLITLLLATSACAAELSQAEAVEKLRDWCQANAYYAENWSDFEFRPQGYQNHGYTIAAWSVGLQAVMDTWRVDAANGKVYVRDRESGKFLAPVSHLSTAQSDGYQRYGITGPPAGAQFLGNRAVYGGAIAYEAWTNPNGMTRVDIFLHYDRSLRSTGWKLVQKDDMLWAQWVLLDGGSRFPRQDANCVARIFELRPFDASFEIRYEEVTAKPDERSTVIEVFQISQDPTLTETQKVSRMRVRQEQLGVDLATTALRYLPIYDPSTHEVHTLDTVMRNMTKDLDPQGDTPLSRDPLGATVRLLWNPSLENISAMTGLPSMRARH